MYLITLALSLKMDKSFLRCGKHIQVQSCYERLSCLGLGDAVYTTINDCVPRDPQTEKDITT